MRVNRRPYGEHGADGDSSQETAEIARGIALTEKAAPQQASPDWIQIERHRLIQGEIGVDEFCPVLLADEREWLLFESEIVAGLRARGFMAQLARHEPEEFTYLVGGEEVLAAWAEGIPAGPGTTKVTSLDKYLDLWLTDFTSLYDVECAGHAIEAYPAELEELLGFRPRIAYRRH